MARDHDLAGGLECHRISDNSGGGQRCLCDTTVAKTGVKATVRKTAHRFGGGLQGRSNYKLAVWLQQSIFRVRIADAETTIRQAPQNLTALAKGGVEAASRVVSGRSAKHQAPRLYGQYG